MPKDTPGYPYGWYCKTPTPDYHVWPSESDRCQCGERDRSVNEGAKEGER